VRVSDPCCGCEHLKAVMKRLRADGDMQPNGDLVGYALALRTAAGPLTTHKLPDEEGGQHATRPRADRFSRSRGTGGNGALSAGKAVAQQQQPPTAEPQQQQLEKAQQSPSGQMGKEEPSSHAPSAKPADNSVFVNGALAVPGAPENTDTVPAKFSEQNAADDKLSIAAYTFKLLTEEPRRAIYTALKGQPAGPAFNADIGAELPSSVELRPMPDDDVARVQQTKDYRYAVADNRVLLGSPVTRYVVGIFVDDVQAPKAGEGRRTP
jgi:hypothetical protein